jgi:hypothetical protein
MRRTFLASILSLALVALVAGCESSTDLDDVSAQGRWDGVGALGVQYPDIRLELTENANGEITGIWRRGSSTGPAAGVNNNGQVTVELTSFEIGTVTFQGRFTNRFRLEGEIPGANIGGPAVFRRIRF